MTQKRYCKLLMSIGKSRNEANEIAQTVRARRGWTYQRHWDMIQCFRNTTFKVTDKYGRLSIGKLDVASCFIEMPNARVITTHPNMTIYEIEDDVSPNEMITVKEMDMFYRIGECASTAVSNLIPALCKAIEYLNESIASLRF